MTKRELPKDVDQLQDMILSMHERMCRMEQQMQTMLREKYGRKSEVLSPDQLRLFADLPVDEPVAKVEEESASSRTGHGRRKPSKQLPRERREYKLSETELTCPGCSRQRDAFGEQISQQYDYVPASIRVIEHVQFKYSCKHCQGHLVVAPKPATVLERCIATEGMVAEVATRKFADHLPLNRIEGIFKRDGANISRSTMCDWLIAAGHALRPLYRHMVARVLNSSIIWTDDTPVKMQDRTDERNMRNARVWTYSGDRENPFTVSGGVKARKYGCSARR